MNIVTDFVRLSNGKIWFPPDGCDIAYALRIEEAKIQRDGKPRKRISRRPSGRSTKAKQDSAIAKALAVTVERVNGHKESTMTYAETIARQAEWEASYPEDDYGL